MNTINQAIRKKENLHIVFWLFKDIAWCMFFKWLGIMMIFPTLYIAISLLITTDKSNKSEYCHNWAVLCWITANSFWMISEFFGFDSKPINGFFHYKHLALIPFLTGLIVLSNYYLSALFIRQKQKNH